MVCVPVWEEGKEVEGNVDLRIRHNKQRHGKSKDGMGMRGRDQEIRDGVKRSIRFQLSTKWTAGDGEAPSMPPTLSIRLDFCLLYCDHQSWTKPYENKAVNAS